MKKRFVILSGAGVSAESGIATFRGADGLWEGHAIEEVASPEGFARNPELVLDFYNQRRKNVMESKPNLAHELIANLELYFDVDVVTQNVDDLHERAGSTKVHHLHGEIMKARCTRNSNQVVSLKHHELNLGDLSQDGAQLRPHIVWFGEAVPMIHQAAQIVSMADYLLVIGTSLNVYPAAGLVDFATKGTKKYIIDPHIPQNIPGDFHPIEKPATTGMSELFESLTK